MKIYKPTEGKRQQMQSILTVHNTFVIISIIVATAAAAATTTTIIMYPSTYSFNVSSE
jgi:hypothetical protein